MLFLFRRLPETCVLYCSLLSNVLIHGQRPLDAVVFECFFLHRPVKTLYCATLGQDEGRRAVMVKLCSSRCSETNLTLVACPVAFSLCFTVTSYVPFSTHCKDYHPSAFATLKKKKKKKCSNTTEIKCPHFTLTGQSGVYEWMTYEAARMKCHWIHWMDAASAEGWILKGSESLS